MQNDNLAVGDFVKIFNYADINDDDLYEGKYAVVEAVPSFDSFYYRVAIVNTDRHGLFQRSELTLVNTASVVEPECPFPIGSMVNHAIWPWAKSYEVVDWKKIGDKWCITLGNTHGVNVPGYDPESLVLVPEPEEPEFGTPILWEGKWYARPSGKPDYYFSLTDWSWMGNVTWDKMKATATVPGP